MLTLNVTPDKAQYKPGETATFKITATDAQGRPVKGHFSLAVVDKSLLALQPDMTPDIRTQFYGFRIQTNIAGADSVYFTPGQQTTNPSQIYYERHALQYPEGMGLFPRLRPSVRANSVLHRVRSGLLCSGAIHAFPQFLRQESWRRVRRRGEGRLRRDLGAQRQARPRGWRTRKLFWVRR